MPSKVVDGGWIRASFDPWQVSFLYTSATKEKRPLLAGKKNSSPELKSSRGILSPFQKVLLGLIRMRLNLSGRDVGYRFGGISVATVSRTFLHVVDALYYNHLA